MPTKRQLKNATDFSRSAMLCTSINSKRRALPGVGAVPIADKPGRHKQAIIILSQLNRKRVCCILAGISVPAGCSFFARYRAIRVEGYRLLKLGRREASWVHLSGCWSHGKIHVCEGPASEVHLCDCCSIGKMQACEGPVSVMHLFRCWHSFRIPPAVVGQARGKLGASFRLLEFRKDS